MDRNSAHAADEHGLSLEALSKRYGDVVALDELTFAVHPGELFGLVGSNGAGKTTAMRIVLGVLAAGGGRVLWHGRPFDAETRRRIGYMPEERGLYPRMRVGEQLVYLARLHGLDHGDAVREMRRWTERLGVDGRHDDEVQTLSLGNQQRVQLAAALVHEPDLFVLDEPFSGLDPVAVDVMSAVLREQCDRGAPAIFSSHQLDLVERICDRVGIVRDGAMVAVGTVDELRSGSNQRLHVHAPAAAPGWADSLTGVAGTSREGDVTVVELESGADDQIVLAAALASGPVREFARRRPSLVELFRHAVRDEAAA